MAERSKAEVCGRSLAEIVYSNSAGGMFVVNVVCCHIEVSATSRSLVQGSPTDFDASCVI